MVVIGVCFKHLNLRMTSLNRLHDDFHILGHTALAEYSSAILCGKYQVISHAVNRMRLSVILHASILA